MEENYIVITRNMVQALGLRGSELLVYALIDGFSQDSDSNFHGKIAYVQEMTGLSRRSVISTIQSLVGKNLVKKNEVKIAGITHISYSTERRGCKNCTGGANSAQGGAKIAPNDNKYNNIYINNNIEKDRKNIKERKKEFGLLLEPYKEKYPREMLADFYRYWCEFDNDADPKNMKWELTKKKGGTFSIGGRLATWWKNNGGRYTSTNPPTPDKSRGVWESMGISKEEYEMLNK